MRRSRSTSPRLASGNPWGATSVKLSHCGSIAPKKNSRLRMIGPPTVAPASLSDEPVVLTEPLGVFTWVQPLSSEPGRAYPNRLPRRSFEPLLVTTLTTPPVDWPNSASKPPVLTWTSCMKSYGVPFPSDPKMIEYDPSAPYPAFVMFTPSTMYAFSRPEPPDTEGFATPA